MGGSVGLIIGSSDGGSSDDFFFNGFAPVGFKSAAWVSDWWLRFVDRWLGWWGVVAIVGSNWFDGLCVCGSVDGLCLCVCGSVCVVMGLDRLIGVSWVCVCGSVC